MTVPHSRLLRGLLGASYGCGGPRVWDLLRGGRTKILMYHGVLGEPGAGGVENLYGYNVPVDEFERHCSYLARRCNVISLRDFLAGEGLASRRTNVVLTFDDGYRNNYTRALPVLERFGLPATFALTTGFVLRREPLYNDLVELAIQRSTCSSVELVLGGAPRTFALGDLAGKVELYNYLMYECVRMPQEERDMFVRDACARLSVEIDAEAMLGRENYAPLAPEDVRAMAQSPLVELASHTRRHFLLSRAATETKRLELVESKREVEAMAGGNVECTSFCVPGGAWDREMVELADAAGYRAILTSDIGVATRGDVVLRRNGVFHQPDLHWFADMVHGPVQEFVGLARRAKHRARKWFKAG
ncbi:MAG: polysaccharide deacetylase family protein [Planctomycetota bacterium]